MKLFILLGIVPLYYGVKLGWEWTVRDRSVWDALPESYKRTLPLRVLGAAALIGIGLMLFLGIGAVLSERYLR